MISPRVVRSQPADHRHQPLLLAGLESPVPLADQGLLPKSLGFARVLERPLADDESGRADVELLRAPFDRYADDRKLVADRAPCVGPSLHGLGLAGAQDEFLDPAWK